MKVNCLEFCFMELLHNTASLRHLNFCNHSARLLRKLNHILLWILSNDTGLWQCNHCAEHGLRTLREEIASTARPKIQCQSPILRYGRSIFCLPHLPNFSDIFDLCLHWVSVVRAHKGLSNKPYKTTSPIVKNEELSSGVLHVGFYSILKFHFCFHVMLLSLHQLTKIVHWFTS